MVAGTRAAEEGLELEATMQQFHAYPPKQRSCCHMDCPLSDLVRRGRSAGRLCQEEDFEPIMIFAPKQLNSSYMT